MNLWGKSWIGCIVLAFFMFSCEDEMETEIGGSLNNNGDGVGVFYEEIPVTSSLFLNDSINTRSRVLVGKHADPDFGSTFSQAFTQFLPARANIAVPENVTIDSVLMTLRVNDFYGTSFNVPSTINAHIIAEPIERKANHFIFESTAYNPEPIGVSTFTINPDVDSLLTIKLSPDQLYLNQWIDLTRNYSGDSISRVNFKESIRGIALVPDDDNSVILEFNIRHVNSMISLYYHNEADSVISINYPFGTATESYGENYTNMTTDRSQTALAGLTPYIEFKPANNMVYLQPGLGLMPKIDVSNVKDFVNEAGNIIVNSAELVIGSVQPFSKFLPPPSSLVLYYANETNRISYVDVNVQNVMRRVPFAVYPNGSSPANPLQAPISDERYRFQLTEQLEAYYSDQLSYSQFFLYPREDFRYAFTSLQQAKIPQENLKIKIYYTKLK